LSAWAILRTAEHCFLAPLWSVSAQVTVQLSSTMVSARRILAGSAGGVLSAG
jgi:hypothetical protein